MRSEGLSCESRVAAWSGAAAGLLGIAGLVGWWFGIPGLTRIAAGYKAIAPSVAIALLILGLALIRLASGGVGNRERGLWAAVVGLISLFGLLELVGFAVGADLNLENALTAYLAKALSIRFETMSPVAGALLFLLGAAMLALLLRARADGRRRSLGDAAGGLAVLAAVVALIFSLGYAYGAPLLYGGPAIPISATAALGTLLLAVGAVAAAGWEHWPLRGVVGDSARARLLRAFVPFTVFVALTVSVAEHRLSAPGGASHILVGAVLAVVFASAVGLAASRIAQSIGETMDRARLAQQRAEEALRESQANLNRAQAVAHTGSWRLDVRRNELLWSDETHRIFGIPQGTPMTYEAFLAAVHPDDREYVDRNWTAALSGEDYDIEHRIVVGDTVKWVREKAEVEFDAGGTLLGGFGTVQDITDRKLAEQEHEFTIEFLQLASRSGGTRDLARAAAAFFHQRSGCAAVGIRLKEGDDYPYCAALGFPQQFVLAENKLCQLDAVGDIVRDSAGSPIMECMCGNVIQGRFDPSRPFFTAHGSFWTNCTTELLATSTEADRQSRTRNRCNSEGYESVALIPVHLGDERLGLIQLNDRRKGMFSPALIALWERLADHLAVALAKCYAEEALRESEARARARSEEFERVLDAVPAAVWIARDPQAVQIMGNRLSNEWLHVRAGANVFRSAPEGERPETFRVLKDGVEIPPAEMPVQLSAAGAEISDYEFDLVYPDGAVRHVLGNATPLRDEQGHPRGSVSAFIDITERKRLEEVERARARDARLLEAIVENSSSQLVYLDRDFNFVWVNPAYAEACRRPREDFAGHNHFEFYPHEENEAIFRRVRDTGEPVESREKPFVFPDMPERGVTYWDWTLTPTKDEKGEVEGLVFSLVDMTEQVRAREQIAGAERERARVAETIAAEINHRMKNNLMLVSGIMQLQLSTQPSESPAAAALRQAISRISALSVVHEQLYEDRSGKVELQYALRRIGEMAAGALSPGNVELSVTGDQVPVHSRVGSAVSVVANELITNAIKYGAPQSDGALHVDIDLSLHDGKLILRIWNSGNPVPADFDVGAQRGMGLQIALEVATRQLKGSFAVRPHDGGTMSEIVIDESVLDGGTAAV